MIPVVWSELPEPNADRKAHDCAYCAIGMCLIHGGFTGFPLGAYTILEREALEDSDTRPDEEGASPSDIDLAIMVRYRLKAHAPSSTQTNRQILTTPNLAVSVGGTPVDAPAGSPIRKYLPNYTLGHRITYLTTERLLLDPLAPNKSAGVSCPVDDVVAFAHRRSVTDLRYVIRNEYALQGGISQGDEMGLRMNLPSPVVAGRLSVPKGTKALRSSDGAEMTLGADATGREAYAMNLVNPDNSIHAKGYILDLTRFGVSEAWFVNVSDLPAGAFKPGGV